MERPCGGKCVTKGFTCDAASFDQHCWMNVYRSNSVTERFCHICHSTILDVLGHQRIFPARLGIGHDLERALDL